MAYSNSDLQKNLLPTLEQIKRYVKNAITVNKRWRDVRPLMSFLQRLPQADQYLLGLMDTLKFAVLSFPYDIVMPGGVTPSAEEEKRLAEMRIRFTASKMQSLFNTIFNGILFGMSAVRLQWKNDPLGTRVVRKQKVQLTDLDFDLDHDDGLMLITTNTNTQAYTRTPLDPETHFFVRYNPLDGIDNNLVGSYMRTTMIYVWLKYYDYFNWARANEKYADPLIWATYRKGAEKEEVDKVVEGLEQLGTDSRAAFSDDVKLQLLEAMRTGGVQSHKELVETIRTEQAILILGQHLTTEIKERGSFAAAKVQNFVREDRMWATLLLIQELMSSQYVQRDYTLNYGEPADGFPVFEFKTDERQDFESNARTFGELKAADPQMQFKRDEVYQRTGWTKPVDGDDVM